MYPWNVYKVHTNTQYLLGELGRDRMVRGSEAPGKQCLLNWEMERITTDDCSLVDGSSDFEGTTFPSKSPLSGHKPIAKLQRRLPHQKSFVSR